MANRQSRQDEPAPSRLCALPDGALKWAVLLILFEGDAAAWAKYLAEQGSSSQRRDDLPLALSVASLCAANESLRQRLRALARSLRSSSM